MKRLIIICEGETEQEFCKDVLYQHFQNKDIYIETPLIKKSLGGIVPWKQIKNQILLHLNEKEVFVTLLIDFYGIKDYHRFPKWDESKGIADKIQKMIFLEQAMKEDISNHRFIAYIQLHEFEGLLFNNIAAFKNNIPQNEITDLTTLEDTINLNPNPELINDGPTTAPSKRLERLIKGYNKVVYGAILATAIGLQNIRNKAVHFNDWITQLENIQE
ncbi:MAG: DUF4276 family protein [Bacteroides sp.]|jgi:hypothetical protein|nr:DUF4276 family protein [Bacteroides sp.]